jgi:hypothetical protein
MIAGDAPCLSMLSLCNWVDHEGDQERWLRINEPISVHSAVKCWVRPRSESMKERWSPGTRDRQTRARKHKEESVSLKDPCSLELQTLARS